MKPCLWPTRQAALNTTVDLRSYINFRYAHQTVAKSKSERFLLAG